MRVAQRYGSPAMGDVVEGRKSTVESVEEHGGIAWKKRVTFISVLMSHLGTASHLF